MKPEDVIHNGFMQIEEHLHTFLKRNPKFLLSLTWPNRGTPLWDHPYMTMTFMVNGDAPGQGERPVRQLTLDNCRSGGSQHAGHCTVFCVLSLSDDEVELVRDFITQCPGNLEELQVLQVKWRPARESLIGFVLYAKAFPPEIVCLSEEVRNAIHLATTPA